MLTLIAATLIPTLHDAHLHPLFDSLPLPLLRLPSLRLQRKKQIDIGKATAGYQRYIAAVPVETRQAGNPVHPAVRDSRCSVARMFICCMQGWLDVIASLHRHVDPCATLTHIKATPSHHASPYPFSCFPSVSAFYRRPTATASAPSAHGRAPSACGAARCTSGTPTRLLLHPPRLRLRQRARRATMRRRALALPPLQTRMHSKQPVSLVCSAGLPFVQQLHSALGCVPSFFACNPISYFELRLKARQAAAANRSGASPAATLLYHGSLVSPLVGIASRLS